MPVTNDVALAWRGTLSSHMVLASLDRAGNVVIRQAASGRRALQLRLTAIEKELLAIHRSSGSLRRLAMVPGIGIISATALAASVIEPERFRVGPARSSPAHLRSLREGPRSRDTDMAARIANGA